MALAASNPDLYAHVRVVVSIITGLCITTLLSGFARFGQHPRRQIVSVFHLGWAASLLFVGHSLLVVGVSPVDGAAMDLRTLLLRLLYPILYYFLFTLLFPPDLMDYSGYEEYFISRRKWIFGSLAATFIADVIDTELKGSAYVHPSVSSTPSASSRTWPYASLPCSPQTAAPS